MKNRGNKMGLVLALVGAVAVLRATPAAAQAGNASAIASLKPDAAKFNARATSLFAKVDGVAKMFDEYVASIKP